jgi:outer membrane lipoprotein carrier protein
MVRRRNLLQASVGCWYLAGLGSAFAQGGSEALDLLAQFMRQVRSGRAQFVQVVTSIPRPGQAPRSKTSSGTLEFQRPGRLRMVYKKPFEQTLVADGQTLWLYDIDLHQVTARRQSQVLGNTPAALLTSAADLQGLQADFQLVAEPVRDGLQWVRAMPKVAEGQIQWALLGLRKTDKGPELAVIDVLDALGQRSVLTFSAQELNPALPAETFVFRPPAGVDLVRP